MATQQSEIQNASLEEGQHNWAKAADLLKRELSSASKEDLARNAGLQERFAHALFRASMQSRNVDEFRSTMKEAVSAYSGATESYNRLANSGRRLRCNAMMAFLDFWVSETAKDKKNRLDEAWTLTKQALEAFDKAGESREYGTTYTLLSISAGLLTNYESSFQTRKRLVNEQVERGERAIEHLSKHDTATELARAYVATACSYENLSYQFSDLQEREQFSQRRESYWLKAINLSEEAALVELSTKRGDIFYDKDEALNNWNKALEYAKISRDRFLIGNVLSELGYYTISKCFDVEEPERKLDFLNKALEYASESKDQHSQIQLVCTPNVGLWPEAPAHYYWYRGVWETDTSKKKEYLQTAQQESQRALERAEIAGYPMSLEGAHYVFSRVATFLSKIEKDPRRRQQLLEMAESHLATSTQILENLQPFSHWEKGLRHNGLADIKSELAELAAEQDSREKILREATNEKEMCVKLCSREAQSELEKEGSSALFASLGERQSEYGELLVRLNKLTGAPEDFRRAAAAFGEAAQYLLKPKRVSHVGWCYWKTAQCYSALQDHPRAAANFLSASSNYKTAAEKIPQLSDHFRDLATYMEAWASIEEARLRHSEENYALAAQSYENVNYVLQTTKGWNHLSKHYAACSFLENGESQSFGERQEDSIKSFTQATELFQEAAEKLEAKSASSQDPLEKQELTDWLKITVARQRYCVAKRLLEEAKQLDKKDEKDKSLERYREASNTFKALLPEVQGDQSQAELQILAMFCEGWARMKEAEIHASPQIYEDAAEIFSKVEKQATKRKFQHLALANSSICSALASGSRFRQSRNTELYAKIKSYLETAGDYYEQAGFEKAAGWTRATQKFFDALVYLADAETKREPGKKAELYHLAEKSVDLASRLYAKAGFAGKEAEARKILRRTREEKELLRAPSEALAENPITFQTSVAPPSLLRDRATGLEKYEGPRIIGRVKVEEKKHYIGSSVSIELEMINAGKSGAALVRVEKIAPEGLEIDTKHLAHPSQDTFIDMRGRRLESLKSFILSVPLRAVRKGVFELRPCVVVVDDRGKEGSYDFEPSVIVLEDPGLPENLQATTADRLATREFVAPMSWFETEQGRTVFQHLVKLFLKDYMSKGLPVEKSGWRSLMDLVRDLELPRSAFYAAEGRDGRVLSELDRRGLVERRIFQEQRGRGGAITRVRVAYDTTTVRMFVKQALIETL